MTRQERFLLQATDGNGEPLKGFSCLCVCLFNKVDGNMVAFKTTTQAAGVEDGLESGGREIH